MNPFSALTSKIFGGLSIFLLIALGVQTLRASHYRHEAATYKLAAETLKASYIAAQEAATAKAIAAKLASEARYRAEAERTDNDYQTALARAQRASDAYRMRNQAGRATGGTPTPAPSDSPGSPDRPRADAVLVSRNDFDILVENSVRLEAAHDWALTLNLAVPDPSFAP